MTMTTIQLLDMCGRMVCFYSLGFATKFECFEVARDRSVAVTHWKEVWQSGFTRLE